MPAFSYLTLEFYMTYLLPVRMWPVQSNLFLLDYIVPLFLRHLVDYCIRMLLYVDATHTTESSLLFVMCFRILAVKTELFSDNTLSFTALKMHKVWTKWHVVASYRKECPCLCHESVWGSRSLAPLIQNLGSMATVPLGKNVGTHWIGGWVGLRASLDIFRKRKVSSSARIQSMDCSACSLVTISITLWWLPW